MTVAALILAAGTGSRFGDEPKLLARLHGKPLVRHVAEAALGSSARPVLLVTGHRAAEVEHAVADLPVDIVPNPDHAGGLSTSLKAGFRRLPGGADAVVVLLADMPRVGGALIDRLVEAWRSAGGPPALIPIHDGQRGNPVVLSTALAGEIERLQGDTGAGPILRRLQGVVLFPVDDSAILQDVDTREALSALRD